MERASPYPAPGELQDFFNGGGSTVIQPVTDVAGENHTRLDVGRSGGPPPVVLHPFRLLETEDCTVYKIITINVSHKSLLNHVLVHEFLADFPIREPARDLIAKIGENPFLISSIHPGRREVVLVP